MSSRTDARQQRMRQQTLNEERISQHSESTRTTERRSSASKLIISSPTPVSYPLPGYNLSSTQAIPIASSNSKSSTQPNRAGGSSLLFACLNTGPNVPGSLHSSGLSSNPIAYSSSVDSTHTSHFSESISTSDHGCNDARLSGIRDSHMSASSPTPTESHPSFVAQLGKSQLVTAERAFEDSIVNDIDSTVSPFSPGTESPRETCFANIQEDQGSDSFDLNNITPSFQVSPPGAIPVGTSEVKPGGFRLNHDPINYDDLPRNTNAAFTYCDTALASSSNATMNESLGNTVSASCPTGGGMPEAQSFRLASTSPLAQRVTTPGSGDSSSLGTSGPTSIGMGVGPSSSTPAGPSSCFSTSTGRSVDDHKVAFMRDRTKKDSHNRIERKRRDYINTQIIELGALLPEEMFHDSDCKKNKGTILKNSVEFIRLLRNRLTHESDIRQETVLAAKVISQLADRIRDLETFTRASESASQLSTECAAYQRSLDEWTALHSANLLQFESVAAAATSPVNSSTMSKFTLSQLTEDQLSGSPGFASITADDLIGMDDKPLFTTSPFHQPRTRCISLNASDLSHQSNGGSPAAFGDYKASSFAPANSLHGSMHHQQQPQQYAYQHQQQTHFGRRPALPSQLAQQQQPGMQESSNLPYSQQQMSALQHQPHVASPALSASLPTNTDSILCGLHQRIGNLTATTRDEVMSQSPFTGAGRNATYSFGVGGATGMLVKTEPPFNSLERHSLPPHSLRRGANNGPSNLPPSGSRHSSTLLQPVTTRGYQPDASSFDPALDSTVACFRFDGDGDVAMD